MSGYDSWLSVPVELGGRRFTVATKPGVFSHGEVDPAALLLARHAEVRQDDVVVQFGCGNGLFGAVAAAGGAGRVLLTDRNVVSVEAARRTIGLNAAAGVEVHAGQGALALPADVRPDLVAIRIPHEKLALLQLMHDAFRLLEPGGRCYLAGSTREGVKSAARTLERLFGNAAVLAHGGGHRIVAAERRFGFAPDPELHSPFLDPDVFNEVPVTLRGAPLTLYSRPGVFSWDHLDEATHILAGVMRVEPGESVLDLGCGAGALGVVAGRLSDGGRICMLDVDTEAVRSAIRTAASAGIRNWSVLPSDVAAVVEESSFEVVVTNPPFHLGKSTDLTTPMHFIDDAWRVLLPGGKLFLVANRTLPYERPIQQRFGNVGILHDGPRFKVLEALR